MRNNFAVFILTHGRAENLITLNALQNSGYTGKWYLILDDEDGQRTLYEEKYGKERIIVFDKKAVYAETDTMDNLNQRCAIIYARNKSWELAKMLKLDYFLMLDDDYERFAYRWQSNMKLKTVDISNIDMFFEAMLDFLDKSKARTVAFAQGGDLMGGATKNSKFFHGLLRKAMNSFFCKVDRPIEFIGTLNEDVNTYTTLGSRGVLFFTLTTVSVHQLPTQSVDGGMTEVYKDGTYQKAFYSVMSMPSAVKISEMSTAHKRMHHRIDWDVCVPKIIADKWRNNEHSGKQDCLQYRQV